eukprot:scaffold9090_cov76-Cyclotella_meneghiniana.AAC.1
MKRIKDEMVERTRIAAATTVFDSLRKAQDCTKQELADAHDVHQSKRFGRGWERSDTKAFLFDAKRKNAVEKGIDPTSVKEPNQLTVDAYHSGLLILTIPGKKAASSKPKPVHRDVGETSERTLLSNTVGTLAPKHLIQFTPYQLISNVDDKACIYSGHQGEGTGDGISDEPGLVIVNEGVMNQGYDIHDGRDNQKH